MRSTKLRTFSAIGLASGAAVALSSCGPTKTITLPSALQDGVPGSLRDAIQQANAATDSPFVIELSKGEYVLDRCGGSDDTNATGDLDVLTSAPITIVGVEAGVVIRQSCAGERVIDVRGLGNLSLVKVTITGGSLVAAEGSGPAEGGGVRTRGNVELDAAIITANSVTGSPGRGSSAKGSPVAGGAAFGGGLFVGGALKATNAHITLNTVSGGRGGDATTSTGVASSGNDAEGGGAYVVGAIAISGGLFDGNRALGGPGGNTGNPEYGGSGGAARGGAIAQRDTTGSIELSNAMFTNCQAKGGVAGHHIEGYNLGPPSAHWAGLALGGAVAGSGPLVARGITANGNSALGGNHGETCGGTCGNQATGLPGAAHGGAIASIGTASVTDSTFAQNVAVSGETWTCWFGSRLCYAPYGSPGAKAGGGAIWSDKALTLTGGAFSRNSAKQGASGLLAEWPDGLARGGAVGSEAAVTIAGGQYSSNAVESGFGGAISGGAVSVTAGAFTLNTASGRGGAIAAVSLDAERVRASENRAGGLGGGAFAVSGAATLDESDVSQNVVDSDQSKARQVAGGGGISVGGHLQMRRSLVRGNSGSGSWTALVSGSVFTFPVLFVGGGVRAGSMFGEAITLTENKINAFTITSNTTYQLVGPSGGAGIASGGGVVLINSTLSANEASGYLETFPSYVLPAQGAAIFAASISLDHVTVADNVGTASLAGTHLQSNRSVLIPGSSQRACAQGLTADHPASSYNWFADATCALPTANNRQESGNFALDALADNGGTVPTRMLGVGSVLVDAIPIAACIVPADARGVVRPQGAGCDVGAVEAR
ncbi:MAG TPA: choice-of-anchor Q domain-containing protein [Polyangiaceae bacterium]